MKKATYFSVLLAVLLLAISLISIFLEQNYHSLLLPLGIGTLLLVTLPLILMTYRDASKKRKPQPNQHQIHKQKIKSTVKNTNDKNAPHYPSFGKRRSGLTWGGGNIHASTAKRGSKRRFLEK
jgi:ABC-type transport system involved in multi-copper enzyme maturation permease subunit